MLHRYNQNVSLLNPIQPETNLKISAEEIPVHPNAIKMIQNCLGVTFHFSRSRLNML